MLMLTVPCFARIGETPQQCMARYGEPIYTKDHEFIVEGVFDKNGFKISIFFFKPDLTAQLILFEKKEGRVSEDFAKAVLEANSGGMEWRSTGIRSWVRSDNMLQARLSPGSLTLTSKRAAIHMEKVASEQNKVETEGF